MSDRDDLGLDLDGTGDDLGYYDFGDDDGDETGDDDDETGGMDYPSLGSMDYASLGARAPRKFKPRGHSQRQRPRGARPKARPQVVQKTIVIGQTANLVNPGQGVVTIRPQFDFVAEDVTFQGRVNGSRGGVAGTWTINTIQFGDRIVFNNPVAVPAAIFDTNSFVRGLVKGAAIAAGLDIQVTANVTQAGATTVARLVATFTGLKRGSSGCGPGAV